MFKFFFLIHCLKKKIDKVVKDSVEKIFKLGENKTSLELSLLFLTLIASMQYDPASTFGLLKY